MQSRALLACLLLALLGPAAPQSELRQDEPVGLLEPELDDLIPEVFIPTSSNGQVPEKQPCPGANQDFERTEPAEPNAGVERHVLQPSDLVRAALPSAPRSRVSVVGQLLSTAWRQLFRNPQSLRSRHKRTSNPLMKIFFPPPSTLKHKFDSASLPLVTSTRAPPTLPEVTTTSPLPAVKDFDFAVDLPNPVVHRLGAVPLTEREQTSTTASLQDRVESSTKDDAAAHTEAPEQLGGTEESVVPTAHRSLQHPDSGATERRFPELLLVLTLIAKLIA